MCVRLPSNLVIMYQLVGHLLMQQQQQQQPLKYNRSLLELEEEEEEGVSTARLSYFEGEGRTFGVEEYLMSFSFSNEVCCGFLTG